MQAAKPITGIQVPSEKTCAVLTPTADNSSIPVSVKYTCMDEQDMSIYRSKPEPQCFVLTRT